MKKFIGYLQYVIFLGLGIGLGWWQLSNMSENDKAEFSKAFANANYLVVLPVALVNIFSHFLRSLRWRMLLTQLGHKPNKMNCFASTLISNSVNSVLPRVGELLKCTLLARKEHFALDKVLGTLLVERLVDILCFIAFIIFTLSIQAGQFVDFFKEQLGDKFIGNLAGSLPKIIFVSLLAGMVIWAIINYARKKPGNRVLGFFASTLKGFATGIATIKKIKNVKWFVLLSILIWCCYLLQMYISFYVLDETSHMGFRAACAVLTFASLSLIITPGGMGSFPIFVMKVMLIFGIPAALGNAFGWIMWGVSTAVVLVTGLIAWIIFPYLPQKHQSPQKLGPA